MNSSLTRNAIQVLESRYLIRDQNNKLRETPDELFVRVSKAVAQAEAKWNKKSGVKKWEKTFYEMLSELLFLPNSPTLMNAGTELGQLSACFVIPIEDNLEQIFESLKLMATVQQSGGGTGFSFSKLRMKGDPVSATSGVASGPVSFMRIFDVATENIRQGGRRRGANMGILRVDHPDIEEFIEAKLDNEKFVNFNLSVGMTDHFMKAVQKSQSFYLVDPYDGKKKKKILARNLFRKIAEAAWKTGDPGLVFLDTINRANPTPSLGVIEATNPCGEVPLLAYEACNLGSLNLTKMIRPLGKSWEFDWDKLNSLVPLAIRFLDDVIEVGKWPSGEIEEQVKANRKIGLGVMGFAEVLILLGIPYDSLEASKFASQLMKTISDLAWSASENLAEERGVFPNWKKSVFSGKKIKVRNATVTSIAPTGTISLIAGTSSGIEPLFGLSYTQKNILDGQTLVTLNPVFERLCKERQLLSTADLEKVKRAGNLSGITDFPASLRKVLRTALEIVPQAHLAIQEAFQKHTDNAVSKTINLSETATVEEVESIYQTAWKRNLKGITVFRDKCRGEQVFELGQSCNPADCKL